MKNPLKYGVVLVVVLIINIPVMAFSQSKGVAKKVGKAMKEINTAKYVELWYMIDYRNGQPSYFN